MREEEVSHVKYTALTSSSLIWVKRSDDFFFFFRRGDWSMASERTDKERFKLDAVICLVSWSSVKSPSCSASSPISRRITAALLFWFSPATSSESNVLVLKTLCYKIGIHIYSWWKKTQHRHLFVPFLNAHTLASSLCDISNTWQTYFNVTKKYKHSKLRCVSKKDPQHFWF